MRALLVSRHPYPMQTTLRRNVAELLSHGVAVDLVCLTPRLTCGARPTGEPRLRLFGLPMRQRRSHAFWYPVHYASFFVWAFLLVSVLALIRRYDVVEVDNTPDFLIFTALVPRWRRVGRITSSRSAIPVAAFWWDAASTRRRSPSFPIRIGSRVCLAPGRRVRRSW